MRVLVVEDEKHLNRIITEAMEDEGYSVDSCFNGADALDYALSAVYDVMILDIMLPKLDGFSLLERVRAQGCTTPVLMLTARASVADRIEGLDKGADYYLAKPFSAGELLACIRALLRRPREMDGAALRFGDLRLEQESGLLSCGEGSVYLNRRELELMRLLMRSGKTPVTRETLILKVWGFDASPESNVVDAYMSFLRKKLSFLGSKTAIVSLRRVGYYLAAEETAL